jgi:hypothetical protein
MLPPERADEQLCGGNAHDESGTPGRPCHGTL